jgi:uncharacterized membrane protein YraQ (UPF0718 family)
MTESILRALSMAFAMGWEILWPLILGFALSAVVQAVVSHREMARLLPDDRPRSIATALALGAASSSCSYVAVALARALFRKGANFTELGRGLPLSGDRLSPRGAARRMIGN